MPRPSPDDRYRVYNEFYQTSYPGPYQSGQNFSFSLRDYTRPWSGTTSPGFPRSRRYNSLSVFKSEVVARDSYFIKRTLVSSPTSTDTIHFVWRPGDFVSPVGAIFSIGTVVHNTLVKQMAINRCIDKVLDRKVNLSQSFAERRQVSNLMLNNIKKLSAAVRALKFRNPQLVFEALGYTKTQAKTFKVKAKSLTGEPSKDWLAYQYGWKPLLSEVKGAAEKLAKDSLGRPLRLTFRHTSKQNDLYPYTAYGTHSLTGSLKVWEHTWTPRETQAHCKLEFQVTNEFLRHGSELGLTDPATLAWELLPWSFVADWFLPIGQFLSRLNYDSGLQFVGGCTTVFSTQETTIKPVAGVYSVSPHIVNLSGGKVHFKSMRLDREIYLANYPPRAVLPAFKDPFSTTHVLNALALFRGQLKNPSRREA